MWPHVSRWKGIQETRFCWLFQEISNRAHWTNPKNTWVSSSNLSPPKLRSPLLSYPSHPSLDRPVPGSTSSLQSPWPSPPTYHLHKPPGRPGLDFRIPYGRWDTKQDSTSLGIILQVVSVLYPSKWTQCTKSWGLCSRSGRVYWHTNWTFFKFNKGRITCHLPITLLGPFSVTFRLFWESSGDPSLSHC